jgi:hypothetical protein
VVQTAKAAARAATNVFFMVCSFLEDHQPHSATQWVQKVSGAYEFVIATMAVLRRVGGGHGGDRSLAVMASAASKLLRAYATQVEALRRLRNGGSQFVRVEHVHVADGGQAVVGVVNTGGSSAPVLAPAVGRKPE